MEDLLNINENLNWPYNDFKHLNNMYPLNQYSNQPYNNIYNSCFCMKSYVRFLNGLLDISDVDIYLNEMIIATNLEYGDFTKYLKLAPGEYVVTIYESGKIDNPIFETNILIERNLSYTGILSGEIYDPEEISIFMIPESKEYIPMNNMTAVKLVNLGMCSPGLNLTEEDGSILINSLSYGETSDIVLPAGRYTLFLRITGDDKNLLIAPHLDFAPGMHYTLFVIGRCGETPKLELIIPENGVNYLDIC